MPEITVGRDDSDLEEYGEEFATAFIGKHIVGEQQEAHTANPLHLDIARPHVMGIFGKRGTGKSYTMGVLAEELKQSEEKVKDNLSTLMIDSMGIFWSMKNPNEDDAVILDHWDLNPQQIDIDLYVPEGHVDTFREKDIQFDRTFAIKPGDLNPGDWALAFDLDITEPMGVLLERIINDIRDDKGKTYTIENLIDYAYSHDDFEDNVRRALINRFERALDWGIFSVDAPDVEELTGRGNLTVLDVSMFEDLSGGWSARTLIVGLLSRKILRKRMESKRVEEIEEMEGIRTTESPIVWMLIDEAHQFAPEEGETAATNPLLQWAKIGREPGVSMVLATQQPNKLDSRILSQMDILLTHRLTAQNDIDALGNIMQTYMQYDITEYIDNLPRQDGAGIILDDNSERVYTVQIRPRLSWHAGGTPSAVKQERT
ncbi:MAG: ATP-binding protein [Candidatus Nanohaloarchaeota archaeon QJJ-7]|nr:ATP-binding protein [Candidatus Nanohaloarchaeota archaeon QJJ-7]